MTKIEVEVVEEELDEADAKSFMEAARRVLLAGMGAVALAQEEMEDFVNRLVERGEIAEKDGRRLINELMEKRKKRASGAKKELESELDERIEDMLHRMNVPSKSDIDALSRKITTLTRKVDELRQAQGNG